MNIVFSQVDNQDDLTKCFCIRAIVFCEGQQIPYTIERDAFDLRCVHVIGQIDNEPVATARLRHTGGDLKIERVAVRQSYRGKGYGHQLMDYLVKTASTLGYQRVKLHAQSYLKTFYEYHGFITHGDMFYEANIAHVLMIKELG